MNKAVIQNLLDAQPEPVDVDAFLEQLVLQRSIEEGEADIESGRVVSHEQAKQRLDRWLE